MGDGPVALVTGAAGGIGSATMARLIRQGWRVVALDAPGPIPGVTHRLSTADDLAAAIETHPNAVVRSVAGDVRQRADCARAVAVALEDFGRLDALVAAAGVLIGGDQVHDAPDEAWQAAWDVNAMGIVNLIRAGADHLPAQTGRVVAVSSAAAGRAHRLLGPYVAAKAAAIGIVRSAAAELAPRGIGVNAVSPGSTSTPLLDASAQVYDLADRADFGSHQLFGRLLEPAEVAAAICFLCSEDASGITGAVWAVDGGMSA